MTRILPAVACLGMLTSGCILVPGDMDDAGLDSGGNPGTTTTSASSAEDSGGSTSGSVGETGSSTGGDTGDQPGDLICSANVVLDPGFEAGSPSESWTEASELFGTPLCDASCSDDEGAGAFEGEWWAWFGGIAQADTASLSQTFVVEDDYADLGFFFMINASADSGNDVFTVSVDDTTVFMVTDADIADYADWSDVRLDLSAYADGQPHELTIAAELTGEGMSSFFVDDIELLGCTDASGTSGSDSGSDTGQATAGSDSSGSDSSGDESGSDTGS